MERKLNLLDENWVRVRTKDCETIDVSLKTAFLQAHRFTALAGENAAQNAAMLRLMLAVLFSVFSKVDTEGREAPITDKETALTRWAELWNAEQLPEAPLNAYFDRWHDRFWLIDPERPFYQIPQAEIGTKATAAKLNFAISESNNKARLFSSRAGTEKYRLTLPEAARHLVCFQSWCDIAYKKSSAKKSEEKAAGEKAPSAGTGWLGKCGFVCAQGDSLFETLLLNLTLLKNGADMWSWDSCPIWELDKPRAQEICEIPLPTDPAELLTVQPRRILLTEENDFITGISMLGGDFFQQENALSEQMTLWRTITDKDTGIKTFRPKYHDEGKQIWREFPALMLEESGELRPGVVEWIALLKSNDVLSRKKMIRFGSVSLVYGGGSQKSSIDDTVGDELTLHADMLSDLGRSWRKAVTDELALCEKAANAVGRLTVDLRKAGGGKLPNTDLKGRSEEFRLVESLGAVLYEKLDLPFRAWLQSLDAEQDEEERDTLIRQWREQARKLALHTGNELVSQAGPAAFAGRFMEEYGAEGAEKRKYHYSAPEAFNRFQRKIYGIYRTEDPE